MEAWRNTGYVPDSDDEEEFESQGTNREYVRNAGIGPELQRESDGEENNKEGGNNGVDEADRSSESIEGRDKHLEVDDVGDIGGEGSNNGVVEADRRSQSMQLQSSARDKHSEVEDVGDIEDAASSSEDELQVAGIVPKKPISNNTFRPPASQYDVVMEDDDSLSSLSPVPSRLDSPGPMQQSPQLHESQHSPLQQSVMEGGEDPLDENTVSQRFIDLLPPLDIPTEVLDELTRPSRRSLRQRLPIQLHPYLLEDAQYRGQFRNAGIKPVRMQTTHDPPANHQTESQGSALDGIEPPSSSPPQFINPPSSPPDPYRSPHSARRHRTPKQTYHSTLGQDETHVRKRKKLFHGDKEKANAPKTSSVQVIISQAKTPSVNATIRPVDIPPSPPRSGSLSSATASRQDGFRFPRGFTPPPKPTPPSATAPLLSADDNSSSVHDDMEIDLADDNGSPLHDDMAIDATDEAGDELPAPNEDDHEDNHEEDIPEPENFKVKHLQRRIKGVLPASWLRLDLKNQGEKSTSERRDPDPHVTHAEPAKGVARKVLRRRGATVQSPTPRSLQRIFSDSSDSDNNAEAQKDTHNAPADVIELDNHLNDTDEDIFEDNRIDFTFPSVPRSSIGPKKSRSSQPKTSKTNRSSHTERSSARGLPQLQTQNKERISRPPKNRVSRPRAPRLGVLDAPDVAQRSRKEQPQFLRVAARKVRQRRDQGRSSPNRKFFRMATLEETEDTNTVLRDWKRGSMKQTKPPVARSVTRSVNDGRQPLQNIQPNTQNVGERPHSAARPPALIEPSTRSLGETSSTSDKGNLAQAGTASVDKEQRAPKSTKRSRIGNMKVISRRVGVDSFKRTTARPAESEIIGFQEPSSAAFARPLAELNKAYRKQTDLTLERFLATRKPISDREPAQLLHNDRHQPKPKSSAKPNQTRLKFSRKRPPTRVDIIDVDSMPQIASPEPPSTFSSADDTRSTSHSLQGLRDYRTFSVDFGIVPIHTGTYFHSSTFIGEGGLSRSINMKTRNLDEDAGFAIINLGKQTFRWGPWNEQVSSEIGTVMSAIMRDVSPTSSELPSSEPDPFHVFASVIRYITEKLQFLDPVDRMFFVERMAVLVGEMKDHVATMLFEREDEWKRCIKLASLSTVLANQIHQIASSELVDSAKKDIASNVVKDTTRQLLSLVFSSHGLQNIHQFYEKNKSVEFREAGIRDGFPAVEAYVVACQILHSSDHFKGWLEETTLSLCADKASTTDIQHLEDTWKAIFTTLPLNEIDESGRARPGLRFRDKHGNWPVAQLLVEKVLDAYSLNSDRPAYYINYCRVVFQRCFLLMAAWGWRDCKVILQTLFGFYAKNMLYNLKTEETFGSPSFLEMLDTSPVISIEPGDSSFQLFIKILGSGLRYLSQINDKKAMKNLAWRFLPNHGRDFPKDKTLDREDLNALRNHHDLLCTLYYAVPDGCRPRLQIIRDLVDPATSHLETCNLSIRSWRRLAHFKLSTNEEYAGLKPFAEWYGSFTSELVRQHLLAKTEVEEQAKGQIQFSKQVVESTITHNQRQIEAILSSTITAMESAVQSSRSQEQACSLVEGIPFARLLGLFDPMNSRVNPIINQTLQIIINLLEKESSTVVAAAPAVNDDSQEYGDWSAIEEVYDGISEPAKPSQTIQYLHDVIQPVVSELLSNCFGQERSPEDSLLLKVTECWSCLAHAFVNNGLHYWNSYLNSFSQHSWTALRTTPQTKKFAPQFLASCIEKDRRFFADCKLQILEMWMSCLVERTSMLKFQHRLTEVLLNGDEGLPLFKNLPFYRREDNRYHITLPEFTDRRISLISSLLSNMREYLDFGSGSGVIEARDEYRELIMALMTSMKANYQELGQSGKVAQGKYVEFVHCILGLMQEHSQAICPLDKYFMDPASFPLPQHDPEYIVAKLRSYGVRLPSGQAAKALVYFLQSVCEVAALDDKQNDLVDQLCASMNKTYESGDVNKPTLRFFLFQCVFPAYIQCALNHPAAWILAIPITKTVSRAAQELLYDIDINDHECIASVSSMFGTILESIQKVVRGLFDHLDYFQEPVAVFILKHLIQAMASMLPVLDYMNRNGAYDAYNMSMLESLRGYTALAITLVRSPTTVDLDELPRPPSETPGAIPLIFTEISAFAARELQAELVGNCSKHNDKYYIRRGKDAKEVTSDIVKSREVMDIGEAREAFVNTAKMFLDRLKMCDGFDEDDRPDSTEETNLYDLLGEGIDDLIL